MGLKELFLSMLSQLTDDEKQQIQDALSRTDEASKEPSEEPPAEAPIEEAAPEVAPVEDKKDEETTEQVEEAAEAEPPEQEETDEQSASFVREEEPAQTQTSDETQEAQETTEIQEAHQAQESAPEMPVDYQSIIDAQNAKIMALEAENKELKAKTEGAFGLVAKPGMTIKTNSLYDDDVSDIHFKK